MKKEDFYFRVYEVVGRIPKGRVTTYGAIARMLGEPQRSRMVGQAMHYASFYTEVPCHRVVNSQGRLVPHWDQQRTLLKMEGIHFKENGFIDLKVHFWEDAGV
ncbi:methylated-DNA--[protein]-cysteine S-methyltransferase [Anoxybacterium hadale]|uniref:Methylated-DNA--[protein]-cysteine S-methyltransferase n=1 Tax=Anoxybacterium hadale TaxID=3408580 RepID=A0ACD1AGZ6_9FIRM|nr:methylated-DNA--[protein]-cysteine S-methyltransferase [Clostridiales bacterium]